MADKYCIEKIFAAKLGKRYASGKCFDCGKTFGPRDEIFTFLCGTRRLKFCSIVCAYKHGGFDFEHEVSKATDMAWMKMRETCGMVSLHIYHRVGELAVVADGEESVIERCEDGWKLSSNERLPTHRERLHLYFKIRDIARRLPIYPSN